MQGEAPWMYITLYSFLFTFTFLNTSSPPPSISLPLFTWLFQYSGVLYSNSYCGLIMFYWTLQLKTTPQSCGILLLLLRLGFLLLHTSWFLLYFLLYQCNNLVSISFLNLLLREAVSSVWLHLTRQVTLKKLQSRIKTTIWVISVKYFVSSLVCQYVSML